MSNQPKTRNAVAQAAWNRKGGPQQHRSTNRNRTRGQQKRRSIEEQDR